MAKVVKHNVVAESCGNCAYWDDTHITDTTSGFTFINPSEIANCSNSESPESGKDVTANHKCIFWKELA